MEWTVEKDKKLRELWSDGPGMEKIAAIIGTTKYQIRMRSKFLGLLRRGSEHSNHSAPWSPETESRLLELRNQGMSWKKISQTLGDGRSDAAVRNKYDRLKVRLDHQKEENGLEVRPPNNRTHVGEARIKTCQYPTDDGCMWDDPLGHHDSGKCGGAIVEGFSYCQEHVRRCYKKRPRQEERIKHSYD